MRTQINARHGGADSSYYTHSNIRAYLFICMYIYVHTYITQDMLDTEVQPPHCMTNWHVSFGSFNTLKKISPSTMRVWSKILARAPTAVLKIKGM